MADGDIIPVYGPEIGGGELENLRRCLAESALIHGRFVRRFEQDIAGFVGHEHGVGTNSGTAALHTALMIAGIGRDEEVLLTSLTFIAPANTIAYVGAHPVFIDVEPGSWQMDPALIERFIAERCAWDGRRLTNRTSGRRVSGIVVVHFLGLPADIDAIMAIAARYGLTVIEDAAQALGTEIGGRRVGGIAPIGCFSFYGNKLITAGGGGIIVTSDKALADKARYLVNQAKDDPIETLHNEIGYNYRMTNIHAAIGCAQFERIDAHIAAKRAIEERYRQAFSDVPGIAMPDEPAGSFCTFWLSSILVDPAIFGMTARQLLARLAGRGIQTIPLYQPLHLSKAHAGAEHVGGAVAESLAERVLSLPSSVGLTADDQERVIAAIRAEARALAA
jgi:perosamine synthetase